MRFLGQCFRFFSLFQEGYEFGCPTFTGQYKDKYNHLLWRSSIILGAETDSGFTHEAL